MKRLAAEAFGTFLVIFISIGGAGFIHSISGYSGSLLPALTYGFAMFAVIALVGPISGAHLNPAVTIGFWAAHRLPTRMVFPYAISQSGGALLAAVCLYFLKSYLVLPVLGSNESAVFSVTSEVAASGLLMFSLLAFCRGAKVEGLALGLYVGVFSVLLSVVLTPFFAVQMNPIRWLTTAILSEHFENGWVYVIGPLVGSCGGFLFCRMISAYDCCSARAEAESF